MSANPDYSPPPQYGEPNVYPNPPVYSDYPSAPQQQQVLLLDEQHVKPVSANKLQKRKDKNTALALFILGFFVFGIIIWPLNFILYRKSKSKKARRFANFSIVALVVIGCVQMIIIVASVVPGIYRAVTYLHPKKKPGPA